MRCPKCESKNLEIEESYVEEDSIDVDLFCYDCGRVVAWHRILDRDWFEEDD